MKSYRNAARALSFLCLLACAEAGFFGPSAGFLSAQKVEEKLVEAESLADIAEKAEAEAWSSFEKAKAASQAPVPPKQNITVPEESKASKAAPAVAPASETAPAAVPVKVPERPTPRKPRNREVMLIKNMKSTGAEGEDAVACVTHCRYGKVRHPWSKCIGRCIEHAIFYDTFMKMLPAEYHPAYPLDVPVPEGLVLPTEETMKRIDHAIHKRQHSAEL